MQDVEHFKVFFGICPLRQDNIDRPITHFEQKK